MGMNETGGIKSFFLSLLEADNKKTKGKSDDDYENTVIDYSDREEDDVDSFELGEEFAQLYAEVTQDNAMNIDNSYEIEALIEKFGETTDPAERERISAEINALKSKNEMKMSYDNLGTLIGDSNLEPYQKDQLSGLYEDLARSTDENELDKINANIQYKLEQFGISGNSALATNLEIETLKILKNKELSTEYEKLSETTDKHNRAYLNANIQARAMQYDTEIKNLEIAKLIQESNLPEAVAEEAIMLFERMSDAVGADERFQVMAEFRQMAVREGLDLNSEFVVNIERNNLEVSHREELSTLYEQLAQTTDADNRAMINAKISQKEAQYEAEVEFLDQRLE